MPSRCWMIADARVNSCTMTWSSRSLLYSRARSILKARCSRRCGAFSSIAIPSINEKLFGVHGIQTSAKHRHFSSLTPNLNAPTSVTVHSAILCVALTGQRTSPAACSEGVALGYGVSALRADRSGRLVMERHSRFLAPTPGEISRRDRTAQNGASQVAPNRLLTHRQRRSPRAELMTPPQQRIPARRA